MMGSLASTRSSLSPAPSRTMTLRPLSAPWSSCGVERWGPYSEHGRALVVGDAAGWSRRRRRRHASDLMARLEVPAVRRVVDAMLDESRLDPVAPGCTL